jgi:hypothetical protein
MESDPGLILIRSPEDIDHWMGVLRASAEQTQSAIAQHQGDPLDLLRLMKFELFGRHPVEDRRLNLIEQINQTWTYAVALAAAKVLLALHPEAGGLEVAPGAHMARPLDVMSVKPNVVGAETFAAVHPKNNNKLKKDVRKLAAHTEVAHRYVFFTSPNAPTTGPVAQYAEPDVEVWSIALSEICGSAAPGRSGSVLWPTLGST